MISKTTVSSAIFAAALGARIQGQDSGDGITHLAQDSGFVSDTPDIVIDPRHDPNNMHEFTLNVLTRFEKHLQSAWELS